MMNVDLGTKGVHESQTIFVRLQLFKSSPPVLNKNLSLFLKDLEPELDWYIIKISIGLMNKMIVFLIQCLGLQ